MSKHTPGPWQFYADLPSADPNWHIVTSASRMRVLANVHIEPGNEMDLANAKLIAAAPDLLEALQRILTEASVEEVDADDCREFIIDVARTAIAKATGAV